MSDFGKNILTLSAGNFVAQLVSIGLMPVITRLYSPDDFGVFALYASIVMVLFSISSLRFNAAIMLPDDEGEAASLLLLSVLSVILVSMVVLPLGIIVLDYFGLLSNTLGNLVWLVPLGVLIQGLSQTLNFWAVRHKKFRNMSIAKITESVSDRSIVLGISVFTSTSPLGLIAGRIVGPFVTLCILAVTTVFPERTVIKATSSLSLIKKMAIRYKNFPLISTWSFFSAALSREVPTILLAVMFSPLMAGMYSLGMRVMNMPMMLVGDSISKVFFQKASRIKSDVDALEEKIRNIIVFSIILIMPFGISILCFGKEIFGFVFGESWMDAGEIVQVLMLIFIIFFLYRIVSVLFDVFEKQKKRLFYDFMMLLSRSVPFFAVFIGGGGALVAIKLMAISVFIVYTLSFMYLFSLVSFRYGQFFYEMAIKLSLFIPFVLALLMLKESSLAGIELMLSISFIAIVQYVIVVSSDRILREAVLHLLLKKRVSI